MSGLFEAGLPMGTWRNLFLVLDNGRASLQAYARKDVEMGRLAQLHPGNLGLLVIIPADATPPSDEARRTINASMERHARALKSVVCVVEGSGFHSAVIRATLTTMTFTLRKMRGWRVVSNAEEGLALLVARTSSGTQLETIDLDEGRRALAELRAAAPAPPATARVA